MEQSYSKIPCRINSINGMPARYSRPDAQVNSQQLKHPVTMSELQDLPHFRIIRLFQDLLRSAALQEASVLQEEDFVREP